MFWRIMFWLRSQIVNFSLISIHIFLTNLGWWLWYVNMTADVDPGDPRTIAEALMRSRQGKCGPFPIFCFPWCSRLYLCFWVFFFFFLKKKILFLFFAEPSDSTVQERHDRITRMTEIDDLRESHDHPVAPLCIKVKKVLWSQQFICWCVFYTLFFSSDSVNVFSEYRILETTLTHSKLMHLELWMTHVLGPSKQNASWLLRKHMDP